MNEYIVSANIAFIINTNDNLSNIEVFAGEMMQNLKIQTQYGNISFGVQNLKVQNTKDIIADFKEVVNENKENNITEEQKEQKEYKEQENESYESN